MSAHTTLQIGGTADMFLCINSENELQKVLKEASGTNLPVTLIGKGSNLLVLDSGIRGLVIRPEGGLQHISVSGNVIKAHAGVTLAMLAQTAARHNLSGLEFAGGIPGTLGGAVCMNAGAYEGEMKQVVTTVRGFRLDGTPFSFSNADMAFGYRHSRAMEETLFITEVTLKLHVGDNKQIVAKMNDFNAKRREKQPLTDLSCGSTFKRPEGHYAAALIEQCGLKGARVGHCEVSVKHAGFLINHPGGTAKEYLALISLVQETVFQKTGVFLEPEVRILGSPQTA